MEMGHLAHNVVVGSGNNDSLCAAKQNVVVASVGKTRAPDGHEAPASSARPRRLNAVDAEAVRDGEVGVVAALCAAEAVHHDVHHVVAGDGVRCGALNVRVVVECDVARLAALAQGDEHGRGAGVVRGHSHRGVGEVAVGGEVEHRVGGGLVCEVVAPDADGVTAHDHGGRLDARGVRGERVLVCKGARAVSAADAGAASRDAVDTHADGG